MNSLLLAFDFGIKSIGVAIGQRITSTAYPLRALKAQNGIPNLNLIEHLFKEWKPNEIIVGLPLNIDGTEQAITAYARKFANNIQFRLDDITVNFHDERLSTVEARRELFRYGGFRALEKSRIDSISAVVILESYLNKKC